MVVRSKSIKERSVAINRIKQILKSEKLKTRKSIQDLLSKCVTETSKEENEVECTKINT